MASEMDFHKNIENIKDTVRKSFANIYATLKAQELKTLRQLDVLRKNCEDDKELTRNCVQNIAISYENESTLLDNISRYGAIDLEKLNFDSSTFTLEDYISPNDDHMYSYKCIEDLTKNDSNLEAIEEAALKQITKTGNCVCDVNIRSEDVSRKFRDVEPVKNESSPCSVLISQSFEQKEPDSIEKEPDSIEKEPDSNEKDNTSESTESDDLKKIDPTDDWLNSIKSHTETEPSQAADVMEHSKIACP